MKKKLSLNKKTIANLSNAHKIVGGDIDPGSVGCEYTHMSKYIDMCKSEAVTVCKPLTQDPEICEEQTQVVNGCPSPSHLDPNCTNNTLDC